VYIEWRTSSGVHRVVYIEWCTCRSCLYTTTGGEERCTNTVVRWHETKGIIEYEASMARPGQSRFARRRRRDGGGGAIMWAGPVRAGAGTGPAAGVEARACARARARVRVRTGRTPQQDSIRPCALMERLLAVLAERRRRAIRPSPCAARLVCRAEEPPESVHYN
jgi:hypothetical protein